MNSYYAATAFAEIVSFPKTVIDPSFCANLHDMRALYLLLVSAAFEVGYLQCLPVGKKY